MPFCINNLQKIQSIAFEDAFNLAQSKIPLSIFSLPNLKELLIASTTIKLHGLMDYNNIDNYSQFDGKFKFHPDTTYSLPVADFCIDRVIANKSNQLKSFVSATKVCDVPCDDKFIRCHSEFWHDGYC